MDSMEARALVDDIRERILGSWYEVHNVIEKVMAAAVVVLEFNSPVRSVLNRYCKTIPKG